MDPSLMDPDTLLQFAGRLHPLLLHLPIGLWLGIAVLEFGGALVRRAPGRATLSILTWVAAFGGAFAAGSGWLLAREGYEAKTVDLHRWLGVAAASIGLLCACFSAMQARGAFRLLLSIEFVVLMAAGHLGSELTHGKEWLFEPFEKGKVTTPEPTQPVVPEPRPEPEVRTATEPAPVVPAPVVPAPVVPATSTPPTFAGNVQPILQRYCTQCHGMQKQKGDLALHDRASIENGGENGPVLVAGRPEVSPLFTNLLLPIDHDDHMPPDGKKQPTANEIEVLRAWIAAGAPFGETKAVEPESTEPQKSAPQQPAPTTPAPEALSPQVPTREAPAPVFPTPEVPAPAVPTPQVPAPTEPPAGGGGTATATTDTPAPIAEPAVAAPSQALLALHKRQVHAAEIATGLDALCIDFGPIAASTTADEVRTLLQPVAARVEDLGLSRVPVDETLLTTVAALPRLRRLDLRSTRTTTEGLRPLARATKLEELVLAATRLDDRAVDVLLQMPSLCTIYAWDSGLTPNAIARLRTRAGLKVDFGDEPARAATPEPTSPATTTPEAKPASTPLAPRNAVCPVSQKPVDARYVVVHEQGLVGFCCPNCPKVFWQEPAKYPVVDR